MPPDAAFVTELVSGTCRALGTYDLIIARASGRALNSLQPAVVDVLRLGTHQLLAMRVPTHAAISATVDLAALQIGERVAGTVNAILRRVAAHDLPGWLELLSAGMDEVGRLALDDEPPALDRRRLVEGAAAGRAGRCPRCRQRRARSLPRRPPRAGGARGARWHPDPLVALRRRARRRPVRRRRRPRGARRGAGRGLATGLARTCPRRRAVRPLARPVCRSRREVGTARRAGP